MPRPFRFGVVEAHAPSRTAWVTIAHRVEELGYATLLIPDRMNVGSLAPLQRWQLRPRRPHRCALGVMCSVMDIVILCF